MQVKCIYVIDSIRKTMSSHKCGLSSQWSSDTNLDTNYNIIQKNFMLAQFKLKYDYKQYTNDITD